MVAILTNDPIPSRRLGEVQAFVGFLEKIRKFPDAVVGKRGDAKARGDLLARLSRGENDIGGFDLFPHFLRNREGGGLIGAGKDRYELFPAIPDHGIRSSDPLSKMVGEFIQKFIPRLMPIGIIERFEMIDVGKEDRKRRFLVNQIPRFTNDDVIEVSSVLQSCQAV